MKTYSPFPNPSIDELKLLALMRRDSDALRARALEDKPAPKRSPETRAKIAAAMCGNSNRKLKPVVSPTSHRRANYG